MWGNFLSWLEWSGRALPWEALTAVAAFGALAVAQRVASRQTWESHQQLCRQAVADIHSESFYFLATASELLAAVQRAAGIRAGAGSITQAMMADLLDAMIRVDRALTVGEMICTEREMTDLIVNARSAQRQFYAIANDAATPPTGPGQIGPARFSKPAAEAQSRYDSFTVLTSGIAVLGRQLYSTKKRRQRNGSGLGDLSQHYMHPDYQQKVIDKSETEHRRSAGTPPR